MAMIKIGKDEYKGMERDVVLICGKICKDGEVKRYNGKDCGKSSIVAQKNEDGSTMFVGLTAWGSEANAIGRLKKGSVVMVVGRLNENEYNGVIYKDCAVDFISTSAVSILGAYESAKKSKDYKEVEDDGELPF